MKIVPVLDIMNGCVVRGVGGQRLEYRPVVSRLTTSVDPLDIAHAIRERYGFTEFYVADLDAIGGARPAVELFDKLRANDFRIWVDSGVRDARDVERIAEHADSSVIGSETAASLFSRDAGSSERSANSLTRFAPLALRVAAKRLIFSLDLRNGQPLGDWNITDPIVIAEIAVAAGIDRIILLDLARVGTNTGIGTEDLTRTLVHRFAKAQIFVGGGVRSLDDVKRLEMLGVSGVLVASALHDDAFG